VKSWWAVLSTGLLLVLSMAGSLWHFHLGGKIVCSVFSGLLHICQPGVWQNRLMLVIVIQDKKTQNPS
jgi:hypothetical protein